MGMKNTIGTTLLLATLFAACSSVMSARGDEAIHTMSDSLVYIGTYTGPKSQGIYVYRLSAATGKLTPLGLAAKTTSPSFLAVDPSHRYLYAVNEVSNYEGKKSGSVSAFSIDRTTGKLTFLNVMPSGRSRPLPRERGPHGQIRVRGELRGR